MCFMALLFFSRTQGPSWQQMLSDNLFSADDIFGQQTLTNPTRLEASPAASDATPLAPDAHAQRSESAAAEVEAAAAAPSADRTDSDADNSNIALCEASKT